MSDCPTDYLKDKLAFKCVQTCPDDFFGYEADKECVEKCPSSPT